MTMSHLKPFVLKFVSFGVLPALCLLFAIQCNPAVSSAISSVESRSETTTAAKISDSQMRVVWMRDKKTGGKDPFGYDENFVLMGLDNRDDRGEFEILSEIGNYRKPLFTPDGQQIIFSDLASGEIRIVNWDGTGQRTLAKGTALDVWKDPASEDLWVYAVSDKLEVAVLAAGMPIVRFRISNPAVIEPVWGSTQVSIDTYQLTADGKRAACLTPWPNASMMDLEANRIERIGQGCWVSMSPDNSYNMWVFDGPHKNLRMHLWGERFPRKVHVSGAPGVEGFEVYHPRWSNHPRFMTMTGPYKVMGTHNAIGGGGTAQVYVGRFNEAFTAIEAWTKVTEGDVVDHFPDVWVKGGESAGAAAPGERPEVAVSSAKQWPSDHAGLEYLWRNNSDQNQIDRPDGDVRYCRARLRNKARYGEFYQGVLNGGGLQALQWEEEIVDAIKKSGAFTLEFSYFMMPRKTYPERTVIAGQGSSPAEGNFSLIQDRIYGQPYLHFRMASGETSLADSPEAELFELPVGAPAHLAVTYEDGELTVYLNGEPKEKLDRFVGDLKNWTPGPLLFGMANNGSLDWDGMIQNVALYSRVLPADEVAAHAGYYRSSIANIEVAPVAQVKATLLEKTDPRPVSALGTYRRDLVEYHYRVDQVVFGTVADKEIKVLHWSILDEQPLPLTKEIGQAYTLLISPKANRPELEGERSNEGMLSDPTLEAWYDVSDP